MAIRTHAHGGVRGADLPRRSMMFEGRFGRIFRALPAADHSQQALIELADRMTAEAEPSDKVTPENQEDDEENAGVSAGFTYLGQFIDHDLTFDPSSSLMKANDPDGLVDFRTPRFDLDCVYGRGPDDQPYLYEDSTVSNGRLLKLGRPLSGNPADKFSRDLARSASILAGGRQRALIGDPRNDENVIVSQLQSNIIRFHNWVAVNNKDLDFADVQKFVRWHYQWIILHEFLPTIVGQEMVDSILPHLRSGKSIFIDRPSLRFFKFKEDLYIPLEFSVAAYRFGHSMVRPQYRLNTTLPNTSSPPKRGNPLNGRIPIFTPDDGTAGLNGFRGDFPDVWAVDWSLFFKGIGPNMPSNSIERVQPAYKIDTSLVNPLGMLPRSVASDVRSLAARNLLRSQAMGMPSGQDVVRAMGEKVIPDSDLKVGKAIEDDQKTNRSITDAKFGKEFEDNAPLWFYILAEAQQAFKKNDTPIRLGPVGGRIVAETFVGILLGDSHSYLSQDPNWTPYKALGGKKFGIADMIKAAMTYEHKA